MKKITIISISVNLFLIGVCFFEYSKISELKRDLMIFQKENKVQGKNIKSRNAFDKNDPIYIFNSRKFLCDSGYTNYESNLCIGEKLHFADSLLTQLLKSKLDKFDKYIKTNKEISTKDKGNTFFVNALKINMARKENLIRTQKLWAQMRLLNSEDVKLGCDGATGCSGIVGKAEIDYVLERMVKIKQVEVYN